MYISAAGHAGSRGLESAPVPSHLEIGIDLDELKGCTCTRKFQGGRAEVGSLLCHAAFAMLTPALLCIDRWQSFLLKLSNTLENWTPGVSSTTDSLTMETLNRTLSSLQSYCFWCLRREWISDHPPHHLSMCFAFVWSFSAFRFDGRKRLHVCVLELLPSSAQSFRLLSLLFFTFSFNIVNSGVSPSIIKTLSQPCFCLQNRRTPPKTSHMLLSNTFVPWLWALKSNPLKNEVNVLQCFTPS